MNIDSPLVPGPCPSGRARTKWTMFSVMSCSAEVMKRFTPSSRQVPSGFGEALVLPAPTSEPASGSVSTMVAPHRRSTIQFAQHCCSGVPMASITSAQPGPDMNMNAAGLAPSIISLAAQRKVGGAPVPPRCSGRSSRHHSASSMAWKERLKPSGMVTVRVAGS